MRSIPIRSIICRRLTFYSWNIRTISFCVFRGNFFMLSGRNSVSLCPPAPSHSSMWKSEENSCQREKKERVDDSCTVTVFEGAHRPCLVQVLVVLCMSLCAFINGKEREERESKYINICMYESVTYVQNACMKNVNVDQNQSHTERWWSKRKARETCWSIDITLRRVISNDFRRIVEFIEIFWFFPPLCFFFRREWATDWPWERMKNDFFNAFGNYW